MILLSGGHCISQRGERVRNESVALALMAVEHAHIRSAKLESVLHSLHLDKLRPAVSHMRKKNKRYAR